VDNELLASLEIGDIPVEMLAALVFIEQSRQLQAAELALNDDEIEQTVVGVSLGSRHESAAVPAGITREAEEAVLSYLLAVVYLHGKVVAEFLEQRIEAADVVSALARDERQLLYLALHSANLGVHTHGALIDGYLVTALNDVKFNGHAVNDVVEIEKFLFGAEKADEIVARAERDNGDLGVLVAECAVDNLIEGAVSAAGIEA